ncbi:MAG: hypothetical protein H0A75_05840 [Candidatus Methanofishera endochildressiae]|uniref:Phosphoribosyltransferase domain-containing protein n=1 Tax=Candidatus Methanofishera endochildressiae TaxID=2738884 RepID=A0A7Z0MP69_9GAMM|nr:hypothetical protein [Candidatus Methanofishera endochildressiae]
MISLSGKQRHKNIKNAFQLRTIPKAHHIAILDDVLTTGATANELASVIKASGISRVDVWGAGACRERPRNKLRIWRRIFIYSKPPPT